MAVEILDSYLKMSARGHNVSVDTLITNRYNDIIFMSALGYNAAIQDYKVFFTAKNAGYCTLYYNNGYCYIGLQEYVVKTKKIQGSDFVHMIAYRKDVCGDDQLRGNFRAYIYTDQGTDVDDELFNLLKRYCSVPILREWVPYIREKLIESSNGFQEMETKQYKPNPNVKTVKAYELWTSRAEMLDIVQTGLRNGDLNIGGSNKKSIVLERCRGIDEYLQLFGEGLAKKIQEGFRAKFTPGEDTYDNYLYNIDDYVYFNAGINLYEAQRSVIQAISNNMHTNKNTFLVGEMGAGKTLMSSAACYVHNANKNKGFNALVMCPSHLVNNWKNEIERFIPNGRSYIVHNLEELLEIKDRLTDPYKVENSFVILSKETAKIGYGSRPAVAFKKVAYYKDDKNNTIEAHNVFVCPECGEVLTKEISVPAWEGSNRKVKRIVPLELTDFAKEYSYNMICTGRHKKYNQKTEDFEYVSCHNSLWTAANRDEEDSKWVKLGKCGWFHVDSIPILIKKYMEATKLNKKEAELFAALSDQHNSITTTGKVDTKFNGTKKYPIASYIKRRMQGVFDYGIFDEIQNYKGQTEQGHAFHILTQSCKKTINCTGTLMNGYVNSMYYLLYRLFPQSMLKEGYKYEDEKEFNRIFGVNSTTTLERGGQVTKRSSKLLPGISALVFTKFLLNNTVFVSLEDMAEGLPNYTEIPYGVQLDEEVAETYRNYEQFIKRIASGNTEDKRMLRQYCKNILTLPDAPNCMEDEIDDNFNVLFSAPEIEEFTTNKDQALMEIVQAKIEAGEKVLVYYNDVGTTNLGDHIKLLINSSGYKAEELKASVKAEKREEYINKLVAKGYDVIICNPALVETGLNLLDFTTIVFYQLGYNLNTMRQASRRSWRLSQTKDISVYFLYYQDTTQEAVLSLMATKLHAALSMEGKFSSEGLRAMSDNQDVLTQLAANVVDGIKDTVDETLFKSANHVKTVSNEEVKHVRNICMIEVPMKSNGRRDNKSIFKKAPKPTISKEILELFK